MTKRTAYEIREAVRGELRPVGVGDEVLTYDLEPGAVPDDLDPRILEQLVRDGLAVEKKKETR